MKNLKSEGITFLAIVFAFFCLEGTVLANEAYSPIKLGAYQAWFGQDNHLKPPPLWNGEAVVPYDLGDPAAICRQILRAKQRGLDGFVIDWYGKPGTGANNDVDRKFIDDALAAFLEAAAAEGDFFIAVMYDQNTLQYLESDDNPLYFTNAVKEDLAYAEERYFGSPAYYNIAGKPAVFVYSYPKWELLIDWSAVRTGFQEPVTLLDKNPDPDNPEYDAQFDGFYPWVQGERWMEDGSDWGKEYLEWFYPVMVSEAYSSKVFVGAVWKEFDDSLASWGEQRFISSGCTGVWDSTWNLVNQYEPPFVLICTVNDYEEGTDTDLDSRYYFPHVASGGKWETEIGIVNESEFENLYGRLTAYDNSGSKLFYQAEVIDWETGKRGMKRFSSTKFVSIPPLGRLELTVGESFQNASEIGYIVFDAGSPSATGYLKFYVDGEYRVAVPMVSRVNEGDVHISHIASSAAWSTGVSLLNTTCDTKELVIRFSDGSEKSRTLMPREHQAFTIRGMFDGEAKPSISSATILDAAGIVGLELFGGTPESGNHYLSGVLLKDETAEKICYPHVASDSVWLTGIVAYNPSDTACDMVVTPYTDSGVPADGITITIGPFDKYIGTAEALNFPEDTAWIGVQASCPITGFELFGTRDGNQLAGYTGVNISSRKGIFCKIEKKGATGLAMVNIGDVASNVKLSAYDDQGTLIAESSSALQPFAKIVNLAENLFPNNIEAASYVKYESDTDVVCFQLNVSSDGMMLDALPGQKTSDAVDICDADGDGYLTTQGDCDDTDASLHPLCLETKGPDCGASEGNILDMQSYDGSVLKSPVVLVWDGGVGVPQVYYETKLVFPVPPESVHTKRCSGVEIPLKSGNYEFKVWIDGNALSTYAQVEDQAGTGEIP